MSIPTHGTHVNTTWHQRFFWILLALLPTQLGYHVWPTWAFILGRRVDYLAPTLYFTDILLLLTLVSYIISNFKFLISKQTSIILLGILFAAVNIFVASNQMVAFYKWMKVAEFVMLGWYIVRTRQSIASIITPLSVGVLYSSVLAIAQFILQRSVGGPLWWLGERTFDAATPGIARMDWYGRELLRPYATFPHPNVLGGYIAAILPLVLFKLSNKKKIYYLSVFLLGTIALFLTFSRSAIAVGAIGMGISIWYAVYRKMTHIVFSQILYTISFILTIIVLASTVSVSGESFVVRQELNAAAMKLWQTAPLFGVGLGNFLVRLPEAIPMRTIYFLQPVHNIYLLLLSEIGMVGVIFIVLLVAIQLKHGLRIKNYGKRNRTDLFIIHNSLFVLLVLGLVDHYPFTLQQGQLLLVVLVAMNLR